MGPSGCGKSTLLHLLGGLDVPDEGELMLQGRRVDTLGEAERAKLRRRTVGYVFQSLNLVASLTARENVELIGALGGQSPAQARKRTDDLLERLGVAARAGDLPVAALGRRAAARRDRAGDDQRARGGARRRADRQPGQPRRRRRHRPARRAARRRPGRRAGHARRARGGPRRPRAAHARRRDRRAAPTCAGDASAAEVRARLAGLEA